MEYYFKTLKITRVRTYANNPNLALQRCEDPSFYQEIDTDCEVYKFMSLWFVCCVRICKEKLKL